MQHYAAAMTPHRIFATESVKIHSPQIAFFVTESIKILDLGPELR
jgi:hypothetical protein